MAGNGWRFLAHTADVGIEARGPDLRAALDRLVAGLAALLAGAPVEGAEERPVLVDARDREELVVGLVDECVYRLEVDGWLATGVAGLGAPGPGGWPVRLRGRPLPPDAEGTPVKAATWGGLSVREEAGGVVIAVYVDT